VPVHGAVFYVEQGEMAFAEHFVELFIPFDVSPFMGANGKVGHQLAPFGSNENGFFALIVEG